MNGTGTERSDVKGTEKERLLSCSKSLERNGKGTEKERKRNVKGTHVPYEKKERERNAFLNIGKGSGTERVP